MKFLVPVAMALALASPAWAQSHTRSLAVALPTLLGAQGAIEAAKTFEVTPEGLRHTPSGFLCPSISFGTVLTGIGAGPLTGLAGEGAVFCEYSDQGGPVARLSIAHEAGDTPVLSDDFCRGLPKAMKLNMGPAAFLPGVGKTTAPAQQKGLPTLLVRGEAVPLWRCSTIREPLQVPVVVADTSALRTANGWTLRAVHTPAPPPCCNAYKTAMPFTFFVQPLLLVAEASGSPPNPFADPLTVIRLKPGAP